MRRIAQAALEGELVEPEDKDTLPGKKGPYVGNLATLPQIRKEMSQVYRQARKRIIPIDDGSRLMYMLKGILDAEAMRMKMTELERQRAEQGMPVFTGFDVKLLPTGESNE